MPVPKTPWPHAPTHSLAEGGTFFVTASTFYKIHYFKKPDRLDVLHRSSHRAAAHSSKGDHLSATGDAEKAIEVDPSYVKAYHRLG